MKLPVPSGSNAAFVMEAVRNCLREQKQNYNLNGLQTEEITASLEKKETVYF